MTEGPKTIKDVLKRMELADLRRDAPAVLAGAEELARIYALIDGRKVSRLTHIRESKDRTLQRYWLMACASVCYLTGRDLVDYQEAMEVA